LHTPVLQASVNEEQSVPHPGSQLSLDSLQTSPALQGSPKPMHSPSKQLSSTVQYSPSLQGVQSGCPVQLLSWQESVDSMQTSLPWQGSPEPTQLPEPSQLSVSVQYRPSSQEVVGGSKQLSLDSWQVLHMV
jgi:hypothetical protein